MKNLRTRIHQPKDILIFRAPPGTLTTPGGGIYVWYTVPTPSARVVAKIAFFYWQQVTGQAAQLYFPMDMSLGLTIPPMGLLMWTAEQAETGVYSPTGMLAGALANVVPQTMPVDYGGGYTGTSGFTIDVQGGQDAVAGAIAVPYVAAYAAKAGINVSLRVRYELVGSDMCDEEWNWLISKMVPQASAPVILVAS